MTENPDPSPAILDAALELVAGDRPRVVFPVVGTSMRPTLSEGDAVLIDLGPRSIRRGDLVLFRFRDGLVVHRCVDPSHARDDGRLRLRGDGRELLDPPVESQAVRGRALALRRNGRWWDLEHSSARAYARAAALHDRFWAGVHGAAPRGARRITGRVDRGLFRLADLVLFRVLHRGLAAPPEAAEPR